MNFIDEASLEVKAGNGGAGAVGFRREKFIPFGGPDGGDGGKGGDIIFKVNLNKNTLIDFRNTRVFAAKNGKTGSGQNKSGAAAEDLILDIPQGTIIYDDISNEVILDCCEIGQLYTVVRGGDGGQGNARFKSSRNQAPRKSTPGFEGEARFIRLELRSLADVGLVGMPNAGKSTFLNTVSSAKPKIGSYPFTTLRPHLGTIQTSDSSYVIADIPGLIEGASEGAGLGTKFLKHISRTGLLLLFIDLYPDENNSTIDQIKALRVELKSYEEDLTQKEAWVVCNKIDLLTNEKLNELQLSIPEEVNKLGIDNVFFISAATGTGTKELLNALTEEITNIKSDLA
ncbi:GTPase ObgE [Gammaproteobacteria bacterium]|jgi:GTP-binding protein|nr:GTPase ObgE [Gammaproteobacteria bacterium]MDA9094522.1 GTPase ObgE [Gammaproteobacteria bacterium]MDA9112909.1 GTPase ObgE [Gammaproteobacteria bacterium]MDB9861660.1 GTPase ObgE [Gammaproteobacteria bacterium]MDB9996815.1 GTPase ObgE [Gammaproteobacteria bacterium]|tara:strand:+ start:3210 stop:4235 length:1026 start_codon:yes stop_codon:yes gene_type:complete